MVRLCARIATLSSALMCCALAVLPGMAKAQIAGPGATNTSVAPAPTANEPETIEVEVPRLMTFETQPTNGTLQKVMLEGRVSYADLDLRTDEGVAELQSRIAQEAGDICTQLAQIYPVYAAAGTSCVNDAIEGATIRANRVIADVREPSY